MKRKVDIEDEELNEDESENKYKDIIYSEGPKPRWMTIIIVYSIVFLTYPLPRCIPMVDDFLNSIGIYDFCVMSEYLFGSKCINFCPNV